MQGQTFCRLYELSENGWTRQYLNVCQSLHHAALKQKPPEMFFASSPGVNPKLEVTSLHTMNPHFRLAWPEGIPRW